MTKEKIERYNELSKAEGRCNSIIVGLERKIKKDTEGWIGLSFEGFLDGELVSVIPDILIIIKAKRNIILKEQESILNES